jgi:hypothetical protein
MRWLFISCIYLYGAPAIGQSFHYFKYQIPDTSNTTYVALLTVFTDGTATVRVRNAAFTPVTGSIFDISLTDSVINNGNQTRTIVRTDKKRLIPAEIYDIKFQEETIPNIPLFEFSRVAGSSRNFFNPTDVYYLLETNWVKATLLENKSFSLYEINTSLVREFYGESDPYFKNLFSGFPASDLATRSLNSNQKKTKIWMIVVTNTLDSAIGKSSMRDKENIAYTFTNIAEKMGLQKPAITYIWGRLFSKAAVQKAIANVTPGPNDIVIFYYSGHGYRQAMDKSRAPTMVLSNNYTNSTLLRNSMNVQWVADQLSKKKSRFNLVISDCCNEEIVLPPAVGREPIITTKAIGLPISTDNFIKLFLEPRGTIVASASDRNQFSVGNPNLGGFFTYHFRISLEYYVSRHARNANWDQIFTLAAMNASRQATTGRCGRGEVRTVCIQHPWYQPNF